jgi:hypothetical protein
MSAALERLCGAVERVHRSLEPLGRDARRARAVGMAPQSLDGLKG